MCATEQAVACLVRETLDEFELVEWAVQGILEGGTRWIEFRAKVAAQEAIEITADGGFLGGAQAKTHYMLNDLSTELCGTKFATS